MMETAIVSMGKAWNRYLYKSLVNKPLLINWSIFIKQWVNDSSLPLFIRRLQDRGTSTIVSGRKILFTDNAPAIWVYSNIYNGEMPPSLNDTVQLINKSILPGSFFTMPGKMPEYRLCHKKHIGLNTRTLKSVHLQDYKQHFLDFMDPENMFILPKRFGELGELPDFIKQIQ